MLPQKKLTRHAIRTSWYSILIFCIIALSSPFLSAKSGYSQELNARHTYLTVNANKAALDNVLSEIEKKTQCRFFYDAGDFDIHQKITLPSKKESLYQILQLLSGEAGLEFRQIGNYFSIRPMPPASKATLPGVVLTNEGSSSAPADAAIPIRAASLHAQKSSRHSLQSYDVDILLKGKVTDEKGLPLTGVTVQPKGGGKATTTDADGAWSLNTPGDAVISFSYTGYETKEISAMSLSRLSSISLRPTNNNLNEVVVVGYGTQKKGSVTAAISSVKGDQIAKAPVANVSSTLGGRVSGVLSRQNSGEPGSDADEIHIRGIATTGNSAPLVIINGIPGDYNQLNPNEIENVTILKDAAAVAPYGLGGANGVILITTKRGKEGKFSFDYNGYYGFQQPTRYPRYLDSYDFAVMENAANANANLPAAWTDADLQKFKDHSDPLHYPDHDWIKEVVNFKAPMTSHTLSFTGGTRKLRVYSDLGYMYQEGIVSVINFRRYNATVDVDADVTASTRVSLDVNGSLTKQEEPGGTSGVGIFTAITKNMPLSPQQLQFPNGKPGNSLLPSIYNSGYLNTNNNYLNARFEVEQKIPFVPGLSLKGDYAYSNNYSFVKNWQTPYSYYTLTAQDTYNTLATGPAAPQLSQTFSQGQAITMQGYLTYQRTFGKHDIGALAVYEQRTGASNNFSASRINYAVNLDELSLGSSNKNNYDNSGSSAKSAQVGWIGRVNYAYASKYLFELSGRYDGHYYFAPGDRFAFFPAASAGWKLSEEHFIKDNFSWISALKLRGSYGKSGNLAGGPFQYLSAYGIGSSYVYGGTNYTQVQGVYEQSQPNPNITWETSKQTDIGLEGTLWKGLLGFEFDFFHQKRSDMLLNPTETIPAEYGIGIAQENEGIMENNGFDFSLLTEQHLSHDLRLNIVFNFSYAKNKLIQTFESSSTYNNPNRRTTGRPLNTQFGLKSLGLYQTSDFLADGKTLKPGEPVPTYGAVLPGDIKYADLAGPGPNGKPSGADGKIDINDYTVIGKPLFPQIIYGFTTDLSWRGLDLSMLWQGAAAANLYLLDEAALPFFNGAKAFKEQQDYWTPAHTNATYPRVMPAPTTNSQATSSFWIRNGAYLRLKTAQIGYTLPRSFIDKAGLHSVRFYVSGQNLLTFTQVKYLDPELGNNRARYYFQQKLFAFGLNVGF
ncbi:MAG TPA: TonB-dependent receptor [Puia sp.]|jgi:TonB-linked SusC/RagA family outer membrane protein